MATGELAPLLASPEYLFRQLDAARVPYCARVVLGLARAQVEELLVYADARQRGEPVEPLVWIPDTSGEPPYVADEVLLCAECRHRVRNMIPLLYLRPHETHARNWDPGPLHSSTRIT